jgi:hypothetical protein
VFHTGFEVDCVTLSSVLGNVGMNEVDDIRSDSDAEDSGENNVGAGSLNDGLSLSLGGVVDVDELSMDHG